MSAAHPLAPASADLLNQDAIRDQVRERYRGVVGRATAVADTLYTPEELAALPRGAVEGALGVNHPLRYASLASGEIVLDLGCGGGIDTLLAARAVGPAGRAIGLDTLPEMLERAVAHAGEAGIANVEWLRGEMENVPLPDASVDVVVSNGVVNLSPRKARAFAEMFRVLRPGGRASLADIVLDEELPPEVLTDPDAWAGWIAGALPERVFGNKLRKAGFVDVAVQGERVLSIDDCERYPLFTPELIAVMRRLIPSERHGAVARSVVFTARRP